MGKKYITTPIYYVNARPHVGHAYTTLAADILARYYRIRGDEVFFQVGTDEHGAKNAEAATKAGKTSEEFVKEHAALFQLAWDELDVQYDVFWRTHTEDHMTSATLFFERLYEVGALYEGIYEGLYCVGCESFLTEKELTEDGTCPDHQKKPVLVKEKNWFFRMSDERKREVKQRIENDEIIIQPEHIKKEVLGLFKQEGFGDFSISREKVEWGISMPNFAKGHTMYVWVEALHNYLAAVGHGTNEGLFAKWWPSSTQFIGKDIIKFHCVWFPAMLLALQEKYPEYVLPQSFLVNGYFTVNGKKMSKSIGNVINPRDLVERYGSDAARWLLVSQFPYGQDGDIQQERFEEQYTSDLVHGIGNVVSRVMGMVEKYNNGVIPNGALDESGIRKSVIECLSLEKQSPIDVVNGTQVIRKAVHELDADIANVEPWILMKDGESQELNNYFYNWLECLRLLAIAIIPVMPNTGRQIFLQLGSAHPTFEPLQGGAKLGERAQLFPRLDI